MAQSTYYFDAHYGTSDIDDGWLADANAFDGSTSTYAYTQVSGDSITNALRGVGTTAPSTGDTTISLVRVRGYVSDDGTGTGWSSYTSLSAPTGGWTWAKVEALTVDLYLDQAAGWDLKGLIKHGSDSLATANFYDNTVGNFQRVYRVEIEVTYTYPVEYADFYFDAHNGTTDPSGKWSFDTNAFDGNFNRNNPDYTAAYYSDDDLNPPTKSGYFLQGDGTNVEPIDGEDLVEVQIRTMGRLNPASVPLSTTVYTAGLAEELGTATAVGGLAPAFGSWATLDTPTGGWTWTKLQNLVVKIWNGQEYMDTYIAGCAGVQIQYTTEPTPEPPLLTGRSGAFLAFF